MRQVRSVTLDTWLPEQVDFISGMGNVKANTFWEAELPQTYKRPGEKDHTGLENFIRAKYGMLPPHIPFISLQAIAYVQPRAGV
jgi:hypothetical protein